MARQAAAATDLGELEAIVECRACPRLVAWREEVAATRRAAFRDEEYWGRPGARASAPPTPGSRSSAWPRPRTAATGPGAIFTGDRSGDVLFAALHRAGLANQPTSVARDDGLALVDTRIFAAVRCAPPDNKPTPAERDTCAPWLHRELALIRPTLRVVVALGAFAWAACWPALRGGLRCARRPRPRPGVRPRCTGRVPGAPTLLGCYHVSQQNTFTGRLTPAMLDDVLAGRSDSRRARPDGLAGDADDQRCDALAAAARRWSRCSASAAAAPPRFGNPAIERAAAAAGRLERAAGVGDPATPRRRAGAARQADRAPTRAGAGAAGLARRCGRGGLCLLVVVGARRLAALDRCCATGCGTGPDPRRLTGGRPDRATAAPAGVRAAVDAGPDRARRRRHRPAPGGHRLLGPAGAGRGRRPGTPREPGDTSTDLVAPAARRAPGQRRRCWTTFAAVYRRGPVRHRTPSTPTMRDQARAALRPAARRAAPAGAGGAA